MPVSLVFFGFPRYGDFRLIDIPGLRAIMPVTMETFLEHVSASSKQAAQVLRTQWLPECCRIVDDQRDEVEKWMPEDDSVRCNTQISHLCKSSCKTYHPMGPIVGSYCS